MFRHQQLQEQILGQLHNISDNASQFKMTTKNFPKRKVIVETQKYKLINYQNQINDPSKQKSPSSKKSSALGRQNLNGGRKMQKTDERCQSPS